MPFSFSAGGWGDFADSFSGGSSGGSSATSGMTGGTTSFGTGFGDFGGTIGGPVGSVSSPTSGMTGPSFGGGSTSGWGSDGGSSSTSFDLSPSWGGSTFGNDPWGGGDGGSSFSASSAGQGMSFAGMPSVAMSPPPPPPPPPSLPGAFASTFGGGGMDYASAMPSMAPTMAMPGQPAPVADFAMLPAAFDPVATQPVQSIDPAMMAALSRSMQARDERDDLMFDPTPLGQVAFDLSPVGFSPEFSNPASIIGNAPALQGASAFGIPAQNVETQFARGINIGDRELDALGRVQAAENPRHSTTGAEAWAALNREAAPTSWWGRGVEGVLNAPLQFTPVFDAPGRSVWGLPEAPEVSADLRGALSGPNPVPGMTHFANPYGLQGRASPATQAWVNAAARNPDNPRVGAHVFANVDRTSVPQFTPVVTAGLNQFTRDTPTGSQFANLQETVSPAAMMVAGVPAPPSRPSDLAAAGSVPAGFSDYGTDRTSAVRSGIAAQPDGTRPGQDFYEAMMVHGAAPDGYAHTASRPADQFAASRAANLQSAADTLGALGPASTPFVDSMVGIPPAPAAPMTDEEIAAIEAQQVADMIDAGVVFDSATPVGMFGDIPDGFGPAPSMDDLADFLGPAVLGDPLSAPPPGAGFTTGDIAADLAALNADERSLLGLPATNDTFQPVQDWVPTPPQRASSQFNAFEDPMQFDPISPAAAVVSPAVPSQSEFEQFASQFASPAAAREAMREAYPALDSLSDGVIEEMVAPHVGAAPPAAPPGDPVTLGFDEPGAMLSLDPYGGMRAAMDYEPSVRGEPQFAVGPGQFGLTGIEPVAAPQQMAAIQRDGYFEPTPMISADALGAPGQFAPAGTLAGLEFEPTPDIDLATPADLPGIDARTAYDAPIGPSPFDPAAPQPPSREAATAAREAAQRAVDVVERNPDNPEAIAVAAAELGVTPDTPVLDPETQREIPFAEAVAKFGIQTLVSSIAGLATGNPLIGLGAGLLTRQFLNSREWTPGQGGYEPDIHGPSDDPIIRRPLYAQQPAAPPAPAPSTPVPTSYDMGRRGRVYLGPGDDLTRYGFRPEREFFDDEPIEMAEGGLVRDMFGSSPADDMGALQRYAASLDREPQSDRRGVLSTVFGAARDMFAPGGTMNPTGPVIDPSPQGLMDASQFGAEMLTPGPGIDDGLRQIGEAREAFREGDYLDAFGRGLSGVMQAGADVPQIAMFAGPTARTANRAMLRKAQDMAEQGADRRAIWDETGWFRGPDGQWRFEIDDSAARFQGVPPNRDIARLDDVMDHPQFFDAYPDARNIETWGEPTMRNRAQYSGGEAEAIQIGRVSDPRSSSLHEMQHAAQAREGFSRGDGGFMLRPGTPAWDMYQDRLASIRRPMSEADFNAQGVGSPEYTYADYLRQHDASMRNPDTVRMLDRAAQEGAVADAYRLSSGEVEARNVQTRMDMTPDQRRATPPWETQDVPDDLQIVRRGGDGPQMSVDAPSRSADLPAPRNAAERQADDIAAMLREGRASEVTDDMMANADPQRLWRLYDEGATGMDMPMDTASRMSRARDMGFDTDTPLYHGTGRDFAEFGATGERLTSMGHGHYFSSPSAAKASSYANATDSGRVIPAYGRGRIEDYSAPSRATREAVERATPDDVLAGYGSVRREYLDHLDDAAASARFRELQEQTAGNWHERAKATMDDTPDGRLFVEWMEPGLENARPADIQALASQYNQTAWRDAGFDGARYGDETVIGDPRNIRSQFARFDPRLSHLRNLNAGVAPIGLGTIGTLPLLMDSQED